jgi:membrane protein YqaA with SNARE-associated domain
MTIELAAIFAIKSTFLQWLFRLGAFGFFLLGIADNSAIPLPGSMDALLVILVAHSPNWWWYYAIFATAGSVLGAYLNYRVFRAGGEEALNKRIGEKRAEKAKKFFEKYGAWSLIFGAICPPPMPIVPFIATAAIMEYPRKWFIAAMTVGRALRFCAVALIVRHYGRHIFTFFSKYYKPAFWTLLVLGVVGGTAALIYYFHWKKKKQQQGELPAENAPEPTHHAA